jgi:tRNA pseudouridine38-40 synthase
VIDGALVNNQTRRYRATIAYDGTGYHGFQRQTNASPTIQGALEAALERITRQQVGVTGAGRTDAGVHATGQVIAFDVTWKHPTGDLKNALNATLPEALAVWQLEEAEPNFHPRFDATSRTYRYRLWQAPVQNPLGRNRQWHVRERLDTAAMERAAAQLLGEHDFATFGTPPQGPGRNTRRTVYQAAWTAQEAREPGACIHEFTIEANAFLYRMVRSLVGTLREVGAGRITPDTFGEILAAADRTRSGPSAPPQGLTLIGVKYEQ